MDKLYFCKSDILIRGVWKNSRRHQSPLICISKTVLRLLPALFSSPRPYSASSNWHYLGVSGCPYSGLFFLGLHLQGHQGELLGIRLLWVFELAILGKPSSSWCHPIGPVSSGLAVKTSKEPSFCQFLDIKFELQLKTTLKTPFSALSEWFLKIRTLRLR